MTAPTRTACAALGLALLVVALAPLPAIRDGLAQDVETTTGSNVAACPFELLARAYSDFIDETPHVLDVYALEKEILLLCQERQQLLQIIAQNDARLQLLMNIEADNNPVPADTLPQEECIQPEEAAAEQSTTDVQLESVTPPVRPTPDEPLSEAEPFLEGSTGDQTDARSGVTDRNQAACQPPEQYEVHSVVRTGPSWQARLRTREGELLRVRLLDYLPDGRRITGIDRLAVTITDAGGDSTRMTFAAARDKPEASPSREGEGIIPDRSGGRETPDHHQESGDVSDSVDGTLDVIQPQRGRP